MRKLIAAFVLLGTLVLAVGASDPVDLTKLTKQDLKEDFEYFARELPKKHKNAFHNISKADYDSMVAKLAADLPSLTYYEVFVRMLQITAKIGDGHTYVHLPATFKRYPLVLYWYGRDLRVTRATADYKDAIATRVIAINGMPIDEVQKRVLSVCSQAENEWANMSNSPGYLLTPEVLNTLGIALDTEKTTFTFQKDDGKQFSREIIASSVPALTGKFIGAAKEEPISRLKPTEPFAFTYFPEHKTMYVNFRTYENLADNSKKMLEALDSSGAKKLVIDLRYNGGGDYFKGRGLIAGILKRTEINQKGHLYVLIGRRTFSAAMVNATDFRKSTNALLVGEPIGERPNSYSENDEMTLPHSKVVVSYSTRYY